MLPRVEDRYGDVPLNFSMPYRRIMMIDELQRLGGFVIPVPYDGAECNEVLDEVCTRHNVSRGRVSVGERGVMCVRCVLGQVQSP